MGHFDCQINENIKSPTDAWPKDPNGQFTRNEID